MTTTSPQTSATPEPLGSFEYEKQLYKDSLGPVWRGIERGSGSRVDLRCLPEWAPLAETREWTGRLTSLKHRGLLRTQALAEDGGRAAVVVEFMDGETLFERRSRRPRRFFEASEIKPWARALAETLMFLHEQGITHGAVHGGNVFVEGTELKLGDLAVSRLIRPRVNESRPLPLPQTAMSPQALAGQPPAPADDIYGLAALLYDLLTGKPVFHSGDVGEQVRAVVPPGIAERRKQLEVEAAPVPEAWEKWIAAALAKDAAKRPALQQLVEMLGGAAAAATGVSASAGAAAVAQAARPPRMPFMGVNQMVMAAAAVITIVFCAMIYSRRILPRQAFKNELDTAFAAASRLDEEQVNDHAAAIAGWDGMLKLWQQRVSEEHPEFDHIIAAARVQRQARLDQKQMDEKTAQADAAARLDARLRKARADFEVARLDGVIRPGDREKLVEAWTAFLAAHDVEFEGKALSETLGQEINEAKNQRDSLLKAIADEKALVEAAILKTDGDLARLRQTGADASVPAAAKITQVEALLDRIAAQPRVVLMAPRIEELRKSAESFLGELRALAEKETPKEPLDLKALFASSACKEYSETGMKRIVLAAQTALKEQGRYAGKPDGGAGKETHEAILAFQKEKSLVPNAQLDDRTLVALGLTELKDDATPMPQVASSGRGSSGSRPKPKEEEKSRAGKAMDSMKSGVKNIGKSIGGFFTGQKK